MSLVVDASVVAGWFLTEIHSAHALRVDPYQIELLAPELLLAEVANILWKRVQRGEIAHADADDLPDRFLATPLEIVRHDELIEKALTLAIVLAHPAYDCFYLALARIHSCRVVTADLRLHRRVERSDLAGLTLWIEDVP